MKYSNLGAAIGCLFPVSVFAQAPSVVTVRINTGVCIPSKVPGGPWGGLGGHGCGPSGCSPPGGSGSTYVYTTTDSIGSTITVSTTSGVTYPPSVSTIFTVYTTTDTRGSTIITSSPVVSPIPPPGSTGVTTYVTTDSTGSVFTTSKTTTFPASPPTSTITTSPPPPGSTGVTTYVTTDSTGSVFTTSKTTTFPASPPTSTPPPPGSTGVTTYVTTDSTGSVFTTSKTTTFPAPPPTSTITTSPPPPGSTGVTTYVTTDSTGSVFTTSITTTFPASPPTSTPPPPGSTGITTYVTTDSTGSVFTTSKTTTFPVPPPTSTITTSTAIVSPIPPPGSTGVTTYVTTDSKGSSFTTSKTTTFPAPPPASGSITVSTFTSGTSVITTSATIVSPPQMSVTTNIIVITTTSGTSVITTSNTIVVTIPQSSGASSPSYPVSSPTSNPPVPNPSLAPAPCPGGSGDYITPSTGNPYKVTCSCSYQGPNVTYGHTDTFQACIGACDSSPSCVAASWSESTAGTNCYLLYSVVTIIYGYPGIDSCRKATYTPANPSATTYSVGSTTSPSVSPVSTTTPTTQPQSTAACANAYTDSKTYQISCGTDYPGGNDIITPHTDTFEQCIATCSNYTASPLHGYNQPCVAVSYRLARPGVHGLGSSDPQDYNCYLKGDIQFYNPNNLGFDSAKLVAYNPPNPPVSTGGRPTTLPATPSSNGIGPATTSSSTTPTSSSSSPSSIGLTSSSSSSSLTIIGLTTSSTSLPLTSPTISTSTATSTQLSGSPSPYGLLPLNATAPQCPYSNNTRHTDFFGTSFDIVCGREVIGDDAEAAHADTFDECLNICDIISGCEAVTFLDTLPGPPPAAIEKNCHPHRFFTDYRAYRGPDKLLSGVTSNRAVLNNTFSYDPICPGDRTTTDVFGKKYAISCDQTIAGPDISPIVTHSLNGCILYCSQFSGCAAANYLGYPPPYNATLGRALNCYPKSDTGIAVPNQGSSYGKRILP